MLFPCSPGRGVRQRLGSALLVGAVTPTLWACENVVVVPADVASVQIVPDEAQVSVGASLQLEAQLADLDGRAVQGQRVTWSSDDAEIASVNGTGQILGVRSGNVTIRARAGSAEGTASVRVLTPASIEVNRASASFSMESGGSAPPPMSVSITNGGEAPLTGLSTSISYGSGGSGWLSASLSGTTGPATLTVRVVQGSEPPPGDYQATIRIAASSATGDVSLPVSLEVLEPPRRDPPNPPSNLRIEEVGLNEIRLSWRDQGGEVEEFEVERRVNDGSFSSYATVNGSTTTFVDGSVQPDTRYTYRVRACNEAGCSSRSDEASAATRPASPTDLEAPIIQRNRVRISWKDNSTTQPVFQVERASLTGSFSRIDTTEAGATRYDDRSVSANQVYRYRVRACNEGGCSDYSNTVVVTVN